MSFRRWILKFSRTIGFKIAAGYSLLFACSFFGLTVFGYIFLEATLARQDRRMVLEEVESLQEQYRAGGWTAFQHTVLANDQYRKNNPFFTRVLKDPNGKPTVFLTQYWKDFDLSELEKMPRVPQTWIKLKNHTNDYDLEIYTAAHPDGSLFQVGISTEDRLADLNRYKDTFVVIAIPLILIAAAGGALFSWRVLRPLRNMIETVAAIEAGEMDARVPKTHSGDELDELGKLFNRMIRKINLLIQGMKNSLDAVAHDLRTPMTRFRNIAESALQKDAEVASYREALQECLIESDRILRMLNMLMDISEAEAGTMRLGVERVNLVPLAEEIVDMYRYVADEKEIRIIGDFPETADLEADADRICQVLANLLDNAVKFTDPGGTVHVRIRNQTDSILIQVCDQGIGIPSDEIDKIWDRLFRGAHVPHKGLGLGLSVVNAVVHAHNGKVHVSSTSESGTVFTVQLPIHSQIPAMADLTQD